MNTAPTHSPAAPASPLTPAGDDPNEKPYPGYARELAEIETRRTAAIRASSVPLPGPLREAFAGEAPTLHGFTLQPVKMRLHIILARLKSPLLDAVRIMREEMAREDGLDESTSAAFQSAVETRKARSRDRMAKEIPDDGTGFVETVFAFTRPAAEIDRLLNAGRDAFRELALKEVAEKLTLQEFGELQHLVGAWYVDSFATRLPLEAPKQPGPGGEGGTVFTKPLAMPQTASAGGSISSDS